MAKGQLPRIDDAPVKQEQPTLQPVAQQVTDSPDAVGYVPRAVDVKMSRDQAVKFKSITRMLEDSGAELANGSPVTNRRRAVLWMIENFKQL